MKAEEILNTNGLTGKLKCRNLELAELDRYDIIEAMHDYAKDQIEKDRERLKADINSRIEVYKNHLPHTEDLKIYNALISELETIVVTKLSTPIILD